MKWTNSYRSFGLKTKRSTGLKTIEHKQAASLLARAGDPRSPASYRPGDINRQLMLAQRLEAACGGGDDPLSTLDALAARAAAALGEDGRHP